LTQTLAGSLGLDTSLVDDLLFTYRSGTGDDLLINLLLWLEPDRTDIAALPVTPSESADFNDWCRLTRAVALQNTLFTVDQSLFELLASALLAKEMPSEGLTRKQFLIQTGKWTLWNSDDLTYLTGLEGLDYLYPDDFCDAKWLEALNEVFAVQRHLGVSVAQAHTWTRTELTFVESASIRQALPLAYDPDRRLEVMADIQDDLRNLKRDALLG
jgi:hypothetical protein